MTTYQYNDGGREAAGFKGKAGDCVVRAIAIASGREYATVYNEVNQLSENERGAKRSKANAGVYTSKKAFKDYMTAMGWRFIATMAIGSGCKVHLKAEELPAGRIICSVSKHYVAVIDGVINDTFDPSRDGTRCVYGYWVQGGAA